MRRSVRVGCAVWAVLGCASAHAVADHLERPEVLAYIDELASAHDFDRYWLKGVFATAITNDDVLAKISRPAEKALAWHEYRRIFIQDKRIDGGASFWSEHGETLARAAAEYNVPPEIIVAIIGVETSYGRFKGAYRVLDALTTLAFDYPRRAKFFKGQLTEFLLLVRAERSDPIDYLGSYAGAMGYGQFIPSSYRAFAVDFDGDGRRDIWRSIPDSVGSVANYFAEHDWRGSGPTALPVELADPALDEVANQGLDLTRTVGELRGRGMRGADGLAADAKAALFRMETEAGPEYWLGLHDFHVITRYNRSAMYALAVLQLSEAIKARRQGATKARGNRD